MNTMFILIHVENQSASQSQGSSGNPGSSDAGPIRATAPMWRCSRIMHMQRDLHPTILSSLEGIVDQVSFTDIRGYLRVSSNYYWLCKKKWKLAIYILDGLVQRKLV